MNQNNNQNNRGPALLQYVFNNNNNVQNSPNIKSSATFLLRGLNPQLIWDNYRNGQYETIDIPHIPINIINGYKTDLGRVSCDKNDETYNEQASIKSHKCVTTNSTQFKIALAKMEGIQITDNKPRLCRWCRKDLSTLPADTVPLGTIIKIVKTGPNQYTLYTIHAFCRMGCNYAELMSRTPYWRIGDLVQKEEKNLRFVMDLLYPGKTLERCSDWGLHERNGGPLTDKEYYSTQYYYHLSPNLIILPAKEEYIAFKRRTKA